MFKEAMEMATFTFPEEAVNGINSHDQHACLACERTFKSRTGWASHAFKCHQRVNEARKFAGGTYFPACSKEYWEYKRLLLHLRYSGDCRRQLAMARMEVEQQPGLGSREQKRQREELLQPWIEVPGVSLPVRDYWAGIGTTWDEELLNEIFHKIPLSDAQVPNSVDQLLEELRQLLKNTTESMLDVAQQASGPRASLIKAFFVTFGQLELTTWLLPRANPVQVKSGKKWKTVLDEGQVQYEDGRGERPQGQWYRTMFVVHFFSGRRREQDLQSYLEGIRYPANVRVEVLSADIIFGEGGDFSQRQVQQKWINWMASGYVLAFYAGPPCETYSVARANELPGVKVRPIRTRLCPWGFSSLTLREARQILIGNLLILFVLRAAMVQAAVGHFACIEHPAEPQGERHVDAVSIWRLQLMAYLYKLQCVTKCTIRQGQYGAPSPKPTTLLFVGPKNPAKSLQAFQAAECSKGVSIGLESGGRVFQTAKLKEYPGPLCAALARALQDWIEEHDLTQVTDLDNPIPEALEHLDVFRQTLNVQAEQMGPDYNSAAKAIWVPKLMHASWLRGKTPWQARKAEKQKTYNIYMIICICDFMILYSIRLFCNWSIFSLTGTEPPYLTTWLPSMCNTARGPNLGYPVPSVARIRFAWQDGQHKVLQAVCTVRTVWSKQTMHSYFRFLMHSARLCEITPCACYSVVLYRDWRKKERDLFQFVWNTT